MQRSKADRDLWLAMRRWRPGQRRDIDIASQAAVRNSLDIIAVADLSISTFTPRKFLMFAFNSHTPIYTHENVFFYR